MNDTSDDTWISRRELADRYGLPVKTPAEWASKGTGPRYARMGRHIRYRLSDVIAWDTVCVDDLRHAAQRGVPTSHVLERIATPPPRTRTWQR